MEDSKWKLSCECGLNISKMPGDVPLSEEQIRTLLSGGKVALDGMRSKAGKKYNANLSINTDQRKIDYEFINDKKR